MEETVIKNIEDFKKYISKNLGAVSYFSTPDCNICKVLKPKLIGLLLDNYPKMKFAYINIEDSKELAAYNQVFTVPTILFHFEGREFIRKSRNINLGILSDELDRPYSFMFDS